MKKAQMNKVFVFLIIMLIFIAVIWPFLGNTKEVVYALSQGGVCQASITLSSLKYEKLCVDIVEGMFNLRCPRGHITITNDNSNYIIKEIRDNKLKETSIDSVEKYLADQLLKTWTLFGSGKKPVLGQLDDSFEKLITNDYSTGCFVYSEIVFDNFNGKKINFKDYLKNNKPNKSPLTYLQIFNSPDVICEDNYQSGGCFNNLEKYFLLSEPGSGFILDETGKQKECKKYQECRAVTPMDKIDTKEAYSIVFIRKRFDSCDGDAHLSLMPYIVRTDELPLACDVFIS